MKNPSIPKWAQPFGEPRVCSICSNPQIYYEKMEAWDDIVEVPDGTAIVFLSHAMKCWCRACFEDCGGVARG